MVKAGWRILSTEEALEALRLAGELHAGKRVLPPEIVEKKKEIEVAIRNAGLFITHLRVVDQGMINEVVEMKLQLDALYCSWVSQETRKRTLH